ncbi:hypothetical protein SAMN05192576_1479 [Nocardioides szechwanensis]|uniref:CHRD domain-containing protein n=2 Tax=Nocardioides szechwanensis TaxID=1005944 RepID=A0A1G9YSK7_9ACTN|nr:hypothetical protein [Nocardioides szechwanensis]SDN12112.1 hypothetical protein SAMN05192576_1479 [Nocardioides szechwanensis]
MRVTKGKKIAAGAVLLSSVGLIAAVGMTANAQQSVGSALAGPTQTRADLEPLNNGDGGGRATVTVDGRTLNVSLDAYRLLRGMPHAQHIHFGATARHECPSVRDDTNVDFRLTTAEGQPGYGPVKVSLTKRGDTSPDSTLAINRFPLAENGQVHYDRRIKVGTKLAGAISRGNAVVVVHGVDYNNNGKYDFRSAGRSELDPSLPAEATDPVLCGVLAVR